MSAELTPVEFLEQLILGFEHNLRCALKSADAEDIADNRQSLRLAKQILKRERERAESMTQPTEYESQVG